MCEVLCSPVNVGTVKSVVSDPGFIDKQCTFAMEVCMLLYSVQ